MIKEKLFVFTLFLFISFSLYFCGGDSSTPTGTTPPDTVKENPSFSQDIQSIFNSNCTLAGCHDATAQAGLNLTQGQAYANIVNVDSTQDPSKKRVLPNDAENSYIVIKIEGRQTTGGRMPLNRNPLSSTQIQNIKNWINRGANNN